MTAANLHKNNWMKHDKLNAYEGFHESGSHILPLLGTQLMKKWEECSKCEYPKKSNWPTGSVIPQGNFGNTRISFPMSSVILEQIIMYSSRYRGCFSEKGSKFQYWLKLMRTAKESHMSINMHRKILNKVFFFLNNIK